MSHLARRIRVPPARAYIHALRVDLTYWQHNGQSTGGLGDDEETPLRAQAIALVEQWHQTTLSPDVRVYLGDNTPFQLTVLDPDATLDDIRDQPGIHPLGAHAWRPRNGHLTVHVFDYVPHHDSLYLRRMRNNCW